MFIFVSNEAMRYFLIGFMGSGKTYWANQWSKATNIPVFDLDDEIEKAENKSITTIFEEKGEDAFRKIERSMLLSFLQKDNYILSCGGGTPCYSNNMKKMNAAGVTIYLKSTPQELTGRLRTEKEIRPLLKDVSDDVLEEFITQKLNSRIDCYCSAMYHLPTAHITNENFNRLRYRHEKP